MPVAPKPIENSGDVRHQRLQALAELETRFEHRLKLDRGQLEIALQNEVVIVEDLAELGGEALAMEQVCDPQRAPRHFVLVGGADAAAGRADGIRALGFLARPVERHVRGENERTSRAHAQPLEHRHALVDEHLRLFEKRLEREHDAVADQALHVRVQDARWDEREDGFLAADDQGMPGVVAALKARDRMRPVGEQIDDLALALIAPLQADHDEILTHCGPPTRARGRSRC